jgi:hypothetical protein
MSDKKTISDPVELEDPIKRGEEEIASIRIRKPGGGELRGLNLHDLLKLDVDTVHELLPRITMPPITKAEAVAMGPADLVSVSAEIADFFVPKGMKPAYPAQ